MDFRVGSHEIPLYQKAISFLDRDIQMRAVASSVVRGTTGQENEAMAILHWTHDTIRPVPAGFPVIDDHPYNIIVRGYGTTDQADDVFSMLAAYAGIPSTMLLTHDPGGYAFAVALINGDWRVFDVRENRAFRDPAGGLATLQALETDPDLTAMLPAPAESHGQSYQVLLAHLGSVPRRLRPYDQMPFRRIAQAIQSKL